MHLSLDTNFRIQEARGKLPLFGDYIRLQARTLYSTSVRTTVKPTICQIGRALELMTMHLHRLIRNTFKSLIKLIIALLYSMTNPSTQLALRLIMDKLSSSTFASRRPTTTPIGWPRASIKLTCVAIIVTMLLSNISL